MLRCFTFILNILFLWALVTSHCTHAGVILWCAYLTIADGSNHYWSESYRGAQSSSEWYPLITVAMYTWLWPNWVTDRFWRDNHPLRIKPGTTYVLSQYFLTRSKAMRTVLDWTLCWSFPWLKAVQTMLWRLFASESLLHCLCHLRLQVQSFHQLTQVEFLHPHPHQQNLKVLTLSCPMISYDVMASLCKGKWGFH